MRIKAVYKYANGMVMAFYENGEQAPELQGKFNDELFEKILKHIDSQTKLNGFGDKGWVNY